MKKCLVVFICLWWFIAAPVRAGEIDDDYADIQGVIDSMSMDNQNISFSDIVSQLMSGELDASFSSLGDYILHKIFYEMNVNRNAIIQIIGISIIGAVFTNFSMAFSKNYVAQTGFYLTYMILFSLLTTSFIAASQIAASVIGQLLDFMLVLVPTFCLALTMAAGVSTSAGYYQLMIIIIAAVDYIISKFIINLISVYIVLALVNNLSEEDYLSKMADLIKTVIKWSLKTILGVTLGLNMIQGMILPAFDTVKSTVVLKATSIIPGVGNALDAAAKAAIGSGVLIKNAVGVGGLIIILILCAVPLIKLVVIHLMYRLSEAIIQPVSDKRIVKCLHIVSEGVMLLMACLGTAVLLFVLSLAIITSSSNSYLG